MPKVSCQRNYVNNVRLHVSVLLGSIQSIELTINSRAGGIEQLASRTLLMNKRLEDREHCISENTIGYFKLYNVIPRSRVKLLK